MTAVSLVEVSTNVSGVLVGAPDQNDPHRGPFIAERVRVHTYAGRTSVNVSGRAIRVDGSIGKATWSCAYSLKGDSFWPPAPAWLVAALRCSGVTW